VPNIPAHANNSNPLVPKRDRAVEAGHRGPAPPVPRAPRAAPRSQSSGALARDTWSRRPGSNGSNTRSADGDAQPGQIREHRRVSMLCREKESVENQCFEMGPQKRSSSTPRRDFSRGHVLAGEAVANRGIPWLPVPEQASELAGEKNVARRHTLLHEQQSADQFLEWAPSLAGYGGPRGGDVDYARINKLKRESSEPFEFLPGAARNAPIGASKLFHGRKNVLTREQSSGQSIDMPRASGIELGGAVPSYCRDNRLQRENPLGFTLRGAGASVLAH